MGKNLTKGFDKTYSIQEGSDKTNDWCGCGKLSVGLIVGIAIGVIVVIVVIVGAAKKKKGKDEGGNYT